MAGATNIRTLFYQLLILSAWNRIFLPPGSVICTASIGMDSWGYNASGESNCIWFGPDPLSVASKVEDNFESVAIVESPREVEVNQISAVQIEKGIRRHYKNKLVR
jgi:hypothetical protein